MDNLYVESGYVEPHYFTYVADGAMDVSSSTSLSAQSNIISRNPQGRPRTVINYGGVAEIVTPPYTNSGLELRLLKNAVSNYPMFPVLIEESQDFVIGAGEDFSIQTIFYANNFNNSGARNIIANSAGSGPSAYWENSWELYWSSNWSNSVTFKWRSGANEYEIRTPTDLNGVDTTIQTGKWYWVQVRRHNGVVTLTLKTSSQYNGFYDWNQGAVTVSVTQNFNGAIYKNNITDPQGIGLFAYARSNQFSQYNQQNENYNNVTQLQSNWQGYINEFYMAKGGNSGLQGLPTQQQDDGHYSIIPLRTGNLPETLVLCHFDDGFYDDMSGIDVVQAYGLWTNTVSLQTDAVKTIGLKSNLTANVSSTSDNLITRLFNANWITSATVTANLNVIKLTDLNASFSLASTVDIIAPTYPVPTVGSNEDLYGWVTPNNFSTTVTLFSAALPNATSFTTVELQSVGGVRPRQAVTTLGV